jgi:hypothetical protein
MRRTPRRLRWRVMGRAAPGQWGMLEPWEARDMSECKHGLRHGCAYCHASPTVVKPKAQPGQRKRTPTSRLSEKMNDRMTALNRRLRELRGQ